MEARILSFIARFTKRHGYPPTVSEIGDAVGLASKATVHKYLNRLQTQGKLTRVEGSPRTIVLVEQS